VPKPKPEKVRKKNQTAGCRVRKKKKKKKNKILDSKKKGGEPGSLGGLQKKSGRFSNKLANLKDQVQSCCKGQVNSTLFSSFSCWQTDRKNKGRNRKEGTKGAEKGWGGGLVISNRPQQKEKKNKGKRNRKKTRPVKKGKWGKKSQKGANRPKNSGGRGGDLDRAFAPLKPIDQTS